MFNRSKFSETNSGFGLIPDSPKKESRPSTVDPGRVKSPTAAWETAKYGFEVCKTGPN